MAFRRRRGFRRLGRGRPRASAFAPAKSGGGNLGWEAAGTTCWSLIETVFPLAGNQFNVVCDGAGVSYQTRAIVLIPINETRGTVTLLRVRGFLGLERPDFGATDGADLRNGTVHFMLQLVPKLLGAVSTPDGLQLLSGNQAADQESSRIVMQWLGMPGDMHSHYTGEPGGAGPNASNRWGREIDVRSKRRFLRSQWALCLSATTTAAGFDGINRVYANFRMLYRADDGI